MNRRLRGEDGNELIEAALVMPLLLLVAVGIFELGRAYQTEQILTNAAREGARLACLPTPDDSAIDTAVRDYLTKGGLGKSSVSAARVMINHNANIGGVANIPASSVTVVFPYNFSVLGPVTKLVSKGSAVRGTFNMNAVATMRNETAN